MPADLERGFLADICANPDDDVPRLIYADWLEDNGETDYGSFIRVQIELARLEAEGAGEFRSPVLDQRYVALLRRERELLETRGRGWIPTIKGLAVCQSAPVVFGYLRKRSGEGGAEFPVIFCRGFIEAITLPCADWLEHGPTLVRMAPIREVMLSNKEPYSDQLQNSFHWLRCDASSEEDMLPKVIFQHLNPAPREVVSFSSDWSNWMTWHDTKEHAIAALSRALIQYAWDNPHGLITLADLAAASTAG